MSSALVFRLQYSISESGWLQEASVQLEQRIREEICSLVQMLTRLFFLSHPKHCMSNNDRCHVTNRVSSHINEHHVQHETLYISTHSRQCLYQLVQGPAILTTIIRYHPTNIPLCTFHLLHYASLFHPLHVILNNTPFNLP